MTGTLTSDLLAGGAMRLIQRKENLPASWGWAKDFSAGCVKAIGALEVLAALGLILPVALDIAPVLVPLAAVGLVVLMVGAWRRRTGLRGLISTMDHQSLLFRHLKGYRQA
jgi:hypothetical protein